MTLTPTAGKNAPIETIKSTMSADAILHNSFYLKILINAMNHTISIVLKSTRNRGCLAKLEARQPLLNPKLTICFLRRITDFEFALEEV